jgi:hypothetical protein
MAKPRRKFFSPVKFQGKVGNVVLVGLGRNKREATKRLRLMFAQAGIPTRPTQLIDLLEVMYIGGQ